MVLSANLTLVELNVLTRIIMNNYFTPELLKV